MKIVFICFLLFCVAIVYGKPIPQSGYGRNGFYYPALWSSRTNYNRYSRYRYSKQWLGNLKRRSSTISYAAIGSAWGR